MCHPLYITLAHSNYAVAAILSCSQRTFVRAAMKTTVTAVACNWTVCRLLPPAVGVDKQQLKLMATSWNRWSNKYKEMKRNVYTRYISGQLAGKRLRKVCCWCYFMRGSYSNDTELDVPCNWWHNPVGALQFSWQFVEIYIWIICLRLKTRRS